jgi:hypothetical protein
MKRILIRQPKSQAEYERNYAILLAFGLEWVFAPQGAEDRKLTAKDFAAKYWRTWPTLFIDQENGTYFINGFSDVRPNTVEIWQAVKELTEIKKEIRVVLNVKYSAVICSEGIIVGCQTFPFETLDELAKTVNEYRKFNVL